MGGSSKTKQTQDNSIDPWSRAQYETGARRVQGILDQPFQPYTGNRVASLSDLEQQAAATFQNNMGAGNGVLNDAAQVAGGATYSPQQIDAGSIGEVLSSGGLEKYMNPYVQDVINTSLGDLERSRQGAINEGQAAATAANAFGGSRHGVADSLTNEAALQTAGRLSSDLRADGYNNAIGLAGADLDRNMNEQILNNQFGESAGRFSLDQAGILGQLGSTMGDANARDAFALAAFGENARNIDQRELDAAYEQYLNQQNDGYTRAQLELGLLGSAPVITDSSGVTSTTSMPGATSIIGTGLQAAAMFSDARLKRNIRRDGKIGQFNAYRYRYVWDKPGTSRRGVMAQEVVKVKPEAVSMTAEGFLAVDYGAL